MLSLHIPKASPSSCSAFIWKCRLSTLFLLDSSPFAAGTVSFGFPVSFLLLLLCQHSSEEAALPPISDHEFTEERTPLRTCDSPLVTQITFSVYTGSGMRTRFTFRDAVRLREKSFLQLLCRHIKPEKETNLEKDYVLITLSEPLDQVSPEAFTASGLFCCRSQ